MGLFDSTDKQLDKQLFQLKLTAKQLKRLSQKCEKEAKAEKLKIKKALEKDNTDGVLLAIGLARVKAVHHDLLLRIPMAPDGFAAERAPPQRHPCGLLYRCPHSCSKLDP